MNGFVNSFMNELTQITVLPTELTMSKVFITLLFSTLLGLAIGCLYIYTFKGNYYSQTFVQTLVIVSVVISMIILIIGSNVARAFSLAGALSIVRFRSAIRDPRDVAFIFFCMGTGLACGASFFLPAALFVVMLSITIIVFYKTNFGKKEVVKKQLRITLPESINQDGLFDEIFKEFLDEHSLIGIKTSNMGTLYELRYLVSMKKDKNEKDLLDEIRVCNGNLNVTLFVEQQVLDY